MGPDAAGSDDGAGGGFADGGMGGGGGADAGVPARGERGPESGNGAEPAGAFAVAGSRLATRYHRRGRGQAPARDYHRRARISAGGVGAADRVPFQRPTRLTE